MSNFNFKKLILPIIFIIISFVVINKCSFHSLPKEKISPIKADVEESYANDEYRLTIKNLIECPNRFILSCQNDEVNEILSLYSPITLKPKTDTTIIIKGQGDLKGRIKINFKWGDPELPIQSNKLKSLPFPKGRAYGLLQGNNSNPTHNSKSSRYAFDFTMNIGDTITSTQNGFIVTVIDGYNGWGYSKKWKAYGNQVMVYDTASNLFTMYGHLKQHGSLVEIGDYVSIGQPIALSGKTGQTSEKHLHFNVFQANNGKGGLTSYPLDSIGEYKVKELKRHQLIENRIMRFKGE